MTIQYHAKPIKRPPVSKYNASRPTPYHWGRDEANGWRIGFGPSSFLVAQGAGISTFVGERLFQQLEAEWLHRQKKRRPVRKKQ